VKPALPARSLSIGYFAVVSRIFRVFLLSLSISIFASASAEAGTIVADSGFRPGTNGFSFANYGDDEGYRNLDATEVQRIFGRAACMTGKGANCVLSPSVRNWMESTNELMSGGHCYGFSALTQLIYKHQLGRFGYGSISAFGGNDPFSLEIVGNERLQRSIARAFTYQTLDSVNEEVVFGAPTKVLKYLIDHLGDGSAQSWNLMIFQWGFEAGHAITPYAVEDMGGGKYEVHVYDNNWPDDDTRRLLVDTNRNTWSYYASTQPGIPAAEYKGNAKSSTLFLKPNTPALGIQSCPVCSGRQGAKSKYNQVTLSNTADQHAHLLITDRKGRQTGYRNGKLINHIPGAKVMHQATSPIHFAADGTIENIDDTPEPVYLLPRKLKLKIRIDGRQMKIRDTESLGVVGPTFDSTIENLRMGPGKVAFATLSPKAKTLSMTGARGESSPQVTFGAQAKKVGYRISVGAINAPSKSTFYFAKKPRYRLLRIGKKKPGKQAWGIKIDKYLKSGKTVTYTRGYRLRGNQVAFLYYGPLAAGKAAYVVIASANGNKVKLLKLKKAS
jgi:hypothetical protein